MDKKILIISDNEVIAKFIWDLIQHSSEFDVKQFDLNHSGKIGDKSWLSSFKEINVIEKQDCLINDRSLIISAHCKQIFPKELVNNVRCVNIHPGYLPFNRGWYPHVFSIINELPAGATIHVMDEKIDHGPIIVRKEIKIEEWDTSKTLYDKIIKLEKELISGNLPKIIKNTYKIYTPKEKGNINFKKDFERLKNIDINKTGSFNDFFSLLRALSFDDLNVVKIGKTPYRVNIKTKT